MTAVIISGGDRAAITKGVWECPNNPLFEQVLQQDYAINETGPEDPNHEHTAALRAIKRFGGQLISFDSNSNSNSNADKKTEQEVVY